MFWKRIGSIEEAEGPRSRLVACPYFCKGLNKVTEVLLKARLTPPFVNFCLLEFRNMKGTEQASQEYSQDHSFLEMLLSRNSWWISGPGDSHALINYRIKGSICS